MDYSNDLLKYGESKNAYNMRFNVRGNVDMTLASWLKATTNAAVVFTNQYAGRGNFWGTASTLRPNWFCPVITHRHDGYQRRSNTGIYYQQ